VAPRKKDTSTGKVGVCGRGKGRAVSDADRDHAKTLVTHRKHGNTASVIMPDLKALREQLVVEMKVKGIPTDDIAKHFRIKRRRVHQIIHDGISHGVLEAVKERMRAELLPKSADIYANILSAHPATLADKTVQKGYELQLKAAKHIAEGTGALGKHSVAEATEEEGLEWYLAQRHELRDRSPEKLLQIADDHHELLAISDGNNDPDHDRTDE
jgi:hypothetical protein